MGLSPGACGAGINAVVFYAPVLFSSLGMGQESALLSSCITGAVFVAATIISILTVDTFGRRVRNTVFWFPSNTRSGSLSQTVPKDEGALHFP